MNHRKIILIIIITLSYIVTVMGQSTNYRLLEIAENSTEYFKDRLVLSKYEVGQFKNILYNYNLKQSEVISDISQYDKSWQDNLNKRNEELKKLLGESRFKLYVLLKDIEKEALYKQYSEIFSDMQSNKEFSKEILDYRVRNILPILSKYNRMMTNNLPVAEFYKYKNLRNKYYEFAKLIDESNTEESKLFSDHLSKEEREYLSKFIAKQNQFLDNAIIELDPYRKKWQKDQKAITQNYYNDNTIRTLDQKSVYEGIYKIQSNGFLLQLIMLVPDNIESYLINLDVILNEEKHFEKILLSLK